MKPLNNTGNEIKLLEKQKLEIEIKKLKKPWREPVIWTTLIAIVITAIINFEPLQREIKLRELQNKIAEIELIEKEKDFKKRKIEIEIEKNLLQTKINNLNSDLKIQKKSFLALNNLKIRKEDSIKNLQTSILIIKEQLKFSTFDLYIDDFKKDFIESPSFNKLYVLLENNPKFEKRLNQKIILEQKFEVKTRLMLLSYRKNLNKFDNLLTSKIDSNPEILNDIYIKDLLIIDRYMPLNIPKFLEKIIELKIEGKLNNLSDNAFFKIFDFGLTFQSYFPNQNKSNEPSKIFSWDFLETYPNQKLSKNFKKYLLSKSYAFSEKHIPLFNYKSEEIKALSYVMPCQYAYLVGKSILMAKKAGDTKMYYDSDYSIRIEDIQLRCNLPIGLDFNAWEKWLKENRNLEFETQN